MRGSWAAECRGRHMKRAESRMIPRRAQRRPGRGKKPRRHG
nr:MAG TPA_asm: hypothetical protein [Caudoviricetes sp.]